MNQYVMQLSSYADLSREDLSAIGAAFDRHPSLRPTSVGGDPPRIKVEPSLASIFGTHDLNSIWISERRWGKTSDDSDGGRFSLREGRGGWFGLHDEPGSFLLAGHDIDQRWEDIGFPDDSHREEIAALFKELIFAFDPAYGLVTRAPTRFRVLRSITYEMPGIFWLNYFGPALVAANPVLESIPREPLDGAPGILIRTSENGEEGAISASELRSKLDPRLFDPKADTPGLPPATVHAAASPGTMEMPWESEHRARDEKKQAGRHARAREKLDKLLAGRPEPKMPPEVEEWSVSFDLEEWEKFAARLARRLGGELSGKLGQELRKVVSTAPHDEEDSVILKTKHGAISYGWFIDDIDVVDFYVFAGPEVLRICDELHDFE